MKHQATRKSKQQPASGQQFSYDDKGQLHFFGKSVAPYGKSDPVYLYSKHHLKERAQFLTKSLRKAVGRTSAKGAKSLALHYAMKANSNLEILKLLRGEGLGIDVVSLGELKLALKAGFKPKDVLFSGVGKTEKEISEAIRLKIHQLNVESLPELERAGRLCDQRKANLGIGIRVNPGVNPETHPYIATGFRENKFGIDVVQLPQVVDIFRRFPRLKFQGLSLHIGSQLFDFTAHSEAIDISLSVERELAALGLTAESIDLGGGVGVDYTQNAERIDAEVLSRFTQVLHDKMSDYPGVLRFEPGRYLLARAGVLLTQVQYLKETPYKKFVVVNTGMNHLLRPALYQAEHRILPVLQRSLPELEQVYDIVGPVCESSDVLGRERKFMGLREGDWLAIADAGAYGFSMASNYNSFPLPKEILI